LTILVLLNVVSYSEATKLELPPYWEPEYGDTWRWTSGHGAHGDGDRYVNKKEFVRDSPPGYKEWMTTQTEESQWPEYLNEDNSAYWKDAGMERSVNYSEYIGGAPSGYKVNTNGIKGFSFEPQ